ncbi:MAG: GNAT family N-acetyltransferase [Candidatus Binatia bacterium]
MRIAQVRKANLEDASGIAFVHVRSWQVAYRGHMPDEFLDGLDVERRANMWRELTQDPDKIIFVAEDQESNIVGFSALGRSRDADANPNTAEVSAIYVHPEKWRKGIGRALLSVSLDQIRQRKFDQVTLWVLEANQRARIFYESFGFIQDGAVQDDDQWKNFIVRELRYRRDLRAT